MKIDLKKLVDIKNKSATYEFEILDKLTAGIVLTGTEIKSIRNQKVNVQDSFCQFERILKLIKDNKTLDKIRPSTVILLTWGNKPNQQSVDEDLEIARQYLGVRILENLPDDELKLVQDSI